MALLRTTKPNKDAPQPTWVRASALSLQIQTFVRSMLPSKEISTWDVVSPLPTRSVNLNEELYRFVRTKVEKSGSYETAGEVFATRCEHSSARIGSTRPDLRCCGRR
jgi:hypothetical protein